MTTNLSQGNSRLFLCPKSAPLCQRREPRHPNEKSAGAKESGVLTFIIALAIWLACFLLMANGAWADVIDDLVPAIIQVESHGNPNAVSPAGAIGLMQITPIVLREFKQTLGYGKGFDFDLYNAQVNVIIGTWYLRRLKDHYLKDKFTIERILAAYNGGITRLRKVNYDVSRMPKESREYVKKVIKLYKVSPAADPKGHR